jgi:hypothetical protein
MLFYLLPKTQAIPVAVLHVKVSATIGLVTNIARDLYALRPELGVKRVGIFDPNVRIPGSALRIHGAVRAHDSSPFELSQHQDNAIARHHTERRRLVPEALIVETELIPIVIRGSDNIIDDEVRRDAPAPANNNAICHQFTSFCTFAPCDPENTLPNVSTLTRRSATACQAVGQFPELVHPEETHRTIRLRSLARTSRRRAKILDLPFAVFMANVRRLLKRLKVLMPFPSGSSACSPALATFINNRSTIITST